MPPLSRALSRPVCLLFLAAPALAAAPPSQDAFWRLSEINKASVVMLVETGMVTRALAGQIAAGIQQVIADEGRSGAKRSGDSYVEFEALPVKSAGPEALQHRRHRHRAKGEVAANSNSCS